MQRVKTVTYTFLSFFLLLAIYESVMLISADEIPIGPLNSLAFLLVIILQLSVFLFNVTAAKTVSALDLISTLTTFTLTGIMFLNRDYVPTLWTLVFFLFTFQTGRLLYRLVNDKTIITMANRWMIVISVLLIEVILISQVSHHILYTTCGISMAILSILLIAGQFMPKKVS